MSMNNLELAVMLLTIFRGRADYVALATDSGFAPYQVESIEPSDLAERHLAGVQAMGFYLLTAEHQCYVTCVDFDNKPESPDPQWQAKTEQVYFALTGFSLVPLVEISQSGNAAHVWLIFNEPTDAWIPRAFWRALGERLGLTFKEVYPRQDRLGPKGLGNLIRYPLWNLSRFVDLENEWSTLDPKQALSEIRAISGPDLRLLAHEAGLGELAPQHTQQLESVGSSGISLRVQRLIDRTWTLLGRRWVNDSRGMSDTSESAVAMSIATELVRLFVPTFEIESAIAAWCRTYAPDKASREDWIKHTVAKAYEFCVDRTEAGSVAVTTFSDCCELYLKRLESGGEIYLSSGIGALDRSIDGIGAGEMCVLAARPGHGKSALAFQWLDSAAARGIPGFIISAEMDSVAVGRRRLLSISSLKPTEWTRASWPQLHSDITTYYADKAPVYVVDQCDSVNRARELIDQMCSIYGCGIVAVDYMQLLSATAKDRYESVTEISRCLKQTARRNNVPLLALSQLNREVEKRKTSEPIMSDLRESGQIEQDADLILFCDWPHKRTDKADPAEYRIFAAKRRNGPIRQPRIVVQFDSEKQLFGDIEI